jgi:F-type H+-transporting ATPase subunit epsilon
MNIKIISPEKQIFQAQDIKEVYIPTTTGIIGVLPEHENLISTLAIGKIIIKTSNPKLQTYNQDEVLIAGGILQIKNDEIIVLADEADLPHELIKEDIEEAIKRAEQKLSGFVEPSELIRLEKELRYHKFKQSYGNF